MRVNSKFCSFCRVLLSGFESGCAGEYEMKFSQAEVEPSNIYFERRNDRSILTVSLSDG